MIPHKSEAERFVNTSSGSRQSPFQIDLLITGVGTVGNFTSIVIVQANVGTMQQI